ncbi:Ig-like domain repeat protein [Solirubrobacter phytolaccae]|uniref:Ig-like domain repeat protein n=1 Tax=Solirubrobacter phytolaccae TaxID=1404360 RepID=A0A9X3NHX4_9ACTN|nr:Ig-like domain repeat protein [Solirubrobacter phytolaccae]MDA0185250.1 Ig-like domain repeat protein [Solirubrobacter phytolaccae]
MRFTLGGVRRAAAILTAVVAAPALLAAPAAADPAGDTIGAYNLSAPVDGTTGSARAVLQHGYIAPSDGFVTDLGGRFICTDGSCGDVKVVVLRETSTPGTWEVVKKSDPVNPDGYDLSAQRLPLPEKLRVKDGDSIAVELGPDASIQYQNAPEGTISLSSTGFGQATKVFETTEYARDILYNVAFEPLPSVYTNFADTAPETVLAGTTSTYEVELSAPDAPSSAPAIAGTVSLTIDGDPLAGCQDLPVVQDKASCQAQAPAGFTYREITATYSGDENYVASKAAKLYQYVIEPAKIKPEATPNPVARSAKITYNAEIANVLLASVGPAGGYDTGTAAFFVDGQPVAGCATQPVTEEGLTKCQSFAPAVAGPHTLKVAYSGDELRAPSQAETPFVVIGPAAQVTDAVAFGSIGVDATETRTVTVTSAGKVELEFSLASLQADPAFAFVSTTCDGALSHGKTCDYVIAYRPTAAGTHTGQLVITHNGGSSAVALSGTAVAPAAPVAPTPTATPTPTSTPKPATIDPEKKPTFTVSMPTGSSANAASVPTLKLPLSCPAQTECELDGKLTIEESALTSRKARASAATTKTVAKFSKVQVEAGGLKTVKLKLSPAFIKSAQQRGIRRIKATLTINTVLGSGEKLTSAQRITIVIPKAAKKQAAAKPRIKPRFTG